MNDKKKLFFIFMAVIVVFLILVFLNRSYQEKRLAQIRSKRAKAAAQIEEISDEGLPQTSLLEKLQSEDFLAQIEDSASESSEDVDRQAKSILDKLQQRREEMEDEEPLAVRVFKVKRVNYEDSLSVTGDIKSLKEIKMRFEKEGVIEQIEVKEGDIVKEGQIIAVLNKKDSLLAVARAQSKLESDHAALAAAEKELELNEILYAKGAIVETKIEEVRLRVESERGKERVSEEELKMAKSSLEKTDLKAPIDGIIGAREAQEGEFFTPRDIVVNLLGIRDFHAEVGIVERDIHRVAKGQKAAIKVDAYPQKEFNGEIGNLYPVVEGRSRMMKAEVEILDKEDVLLPGMFAQVEIFLAKLKSALMAPTMSLLQMAPEVMVVPIVLLDEGIDEQAIKQGEGRGIINLVEIEVGYRGPDYAQIIKGIREYDLVVLEAHGDIEAGRRVRILGMEEYGITDN